LLSIRDCLVLFLAIPLACGQASDDLSSDVTELLPWEEPSSAQSLAQRIAEVTRDFDSSELKMQECLAAQGFDYQVRSIEVEFVNSERTLFTALERVRRFGYGIVDNEGSDGISVSVRSPVELDAQALNLLTRLQAGPCMEHVVDSDPQGAIVGAFRSFDELPDESELLRSDDYAAGMHAWRNCMSDRGFAFLSSEDAFDSLNSEFERVLEVQESKDQVRAFLEREISVATADVECYLAHVAPVVKEVLGTRD
jgi:hypothetical protein